MTKKRKQNWFMLLFALPFAGVGIGVLVFGVIPNLYEWQQMKSWPQVEARVLDAGLHTSRGDDSDTYRAYARYTYRYQMQDYTSERVAIMGGSDNIGDFQSDLARQLELAHRMEQPVPAWVNPNDPGDAVLNRELRWNMLGFKMIFVLVFGGVGNLWGTLVGAMGLGIINKFLEPYAGAVLAKVLVLVLLILFIQKRPKGIFPQKGRAAAD